MRVSEWSKYLEVQVPLIFRQWDFRMPSSSYVHKIWAFILNTSLCKPDMSGFYVMQSWVLEMCGVSFSSRDSKKNMIPIFNSEQVVWLKDLSRYADLQPSARLVTPVWPAQCSDCSHPSLLYLLSPICWAKLADIYKLPGVQDWGEGTQNCWCSSLVLLWAFPLSILLVFKDLKLWLYG